MVTLVIISDVSGEGEYYNVPVIEEEDSVTAHIRKLKVSLEDWLTEYLHLLRDESGENQCKVSTLFIRPAKR